MLSLRLTAGKMFYGASVIYRCSFPVQPVCYLFSLTRAWVVVDLRNNESGPPFID